MMALKLLKPIERHVMKIITIVFIVGASVEIEEGSGPFFERAEVDLTAF
jgi:hypothetical protein